MSDKIKVSICIPAYNNEQAMRRLLASIEKQDYQDYEVILTDDSDTDVIQRLADEKKYVTYYRNEKRLGATANWNAAIKKSSGEYIKIMHHDDWFTDENSLRRFVAMLEEHPEADLAFSGSRQAAEDGSSYDRFTSKEDIRLIETDYRNLFLGNTIGAPSAVIVRRSAVEKADGGEVSGAERISYDEKLTWLVDMEYYMQLLKKNPRFTYTEEPLVSIGTGKGQLTEKCRDNTELNIFEYSYIYEKYHLCTEKKYKKKLIRICSNAGKSSEEVKAYGIGAGEYRWELGKRLLSKIEWKLARCFSKNAVMGALLVCFIMSLIPILMLSGVNQATGDDFGYGRMTHQAWVETHSLPEVLKAAAKTVQEYYTGWQGTWMSIFLFALQPEVFSPNAYVIVPAFMLMIWLGAVGILMHYLLVKRMGYRKTDFGAVYLLAAAAGLQFLPSTKSGIFWYNGTAHYVVPFALALLAVYCYFRFMDKERKVGAYVGFFISMMLLGGGNYQAALFAPIVVVLTGIAYFRNKEKRKKLLFCLLPLCAETVGLFISMKAPGNRARGGEDFAFSLSLGIKTVLACFVKGAVQAWEYIREHPLLLLIFAAAVIICRRAAAEAYRESKKKPIFSYPHPTVFLIFSYCVYCAMFAPMLYAGVPVSGGVYNMNYYVFLFMVFGDMIYVTGAWANRRQGVMKERKTGVLTALIGLGLIGLWLCRSDVKETTSFQCIEYMRSGQARDFKEQMALQKEILLDENITDALLPFINDTQGPLMHMPLTDKPEAFTNFVTKEFYGKNSVTAMPREDWELLTE